MEEHNLRKSWVKRTAQVVAGVIVGLAGAEGLFYANQHGAFPHLNLYQEDSRLGVRLRTNSSMQLEFAGNPKTKIRINRQGYRGQDWPQKSGAEVLVVGDSQVFGLGVEEEQTFSAQLQKEMPQVRVLNGGVPTYGAAEYHAVIEEVGRARKPETVVMVINMSNDLFEAERPNKERHAVWDGWAVRKETAPQKSIQFPGRSFLFNRSHSVFALRSYLHRNSIDAQIAEQSLPSEGTFTDLVKSGTKAEALHLATTNEQRKKHGELKRKVGDLKKQLERKNIESAELLAAVFDPDGVTQVVDNEEQYGVKERLRAARANPGDIVGIASAVESAGPLNATARQIHHGAVLRRELEAKVKQRARETRDLRAQATVASLADVALLEEQIGSLKAAQRPAGKSWSPLAEQLKKSQQLVAEWGGQLLVVVLPLDVQVSEDEWAKYENADRPPMKETLVLNQDVTDAARAAHAWTLDARPALIAAEPGAFLKGDLHMSPQGHAAVAHALATMLQEPPPFRLPDPGLPHDRSRPPALSEMQVEIPVKGSTDAGCATFQRDGWFHMRCSPRGANVPQALSPVRGGNGEIAIAKQGSLVSLTAPISPGGELEFDIIYSTGSRRLKLQWSSGALEPEGSISTIDPGQSIGTKISEFDSNSQLCQCVLELEEKQAANLARSRWQKEYDFYGEQQGQSRFLRVLQDALVIPEFTGKCAEYLIEPRPDCERSYPNDCEAQIACAGGDSWFPPQCDQDSAAAGALGRCLPFCDETRPCSRGSCRPWQGTQLCFEGP